MKCLVYSLRGRHIGLVLLLFAILVLSLSLAACCIGPKGPPGSIVQKGEPGKPMMQPGAALVVVTASKTNVTVAGAGFGPKESVELVIIGNEGAVVFKCEVGEDWKVHSCGSMSRVRRSHFPATALLTDRALLTRTFLIERAPHTIGQNG